MAGVVRPYRGISADERRASRRARLLDAALEEVGERGMAGTTMTAVCARAGLTERYFYESFADRDEMLRAVQLALRQNIDRLKGWLEFADIALIPILVGIAAIIIGIVRLQRRKRRAAFG